MWPFKKKEEKEKVLPPYRISQSVEGDWMIQAIRYRYGAVMLGPIPVYETIHRGFDTAEEAEIRLNDWRAAKSIYLDYNAERVS